MASATGHASIDMLEELVDEFASKRPTDTASKFETIKLMIRIVECQVEIKARMAELASKINKAADDHSRYFDQSE